jgi:type II secretory pathway pseudopilin PulG
MDRRQGITVLELLVVMAVMGLLVALLLPAILASRERARDADCRSRLKQLGLAIHQFESQHERLPGRDILPWSIALLPSLEEHRVFAVFRPDLDPTISPNLELGRTVVNALLCPSAATIAIPPNGWVPTHYALNSQVAGLRLAQVSDGTSTTVGGFEYASADEPWLQPPLFEPGTEDLNNCRHETLHVVLLDGSVKAIGRSVAEDVLSAISTASGAEVVAGYGQ